MNERCLVKKLNDTVQFNLRLNCEKYNISVKSEGKDVLIEANFNIDNYMDIEKQFKKYINVIREIFPEPIKEYINDRVVVDMYEGKSNLYINSSFKSGECKVIASLDYEDYIDKAEKYIIYVPNI